jgi:hypothetical protein
MQCQGSERVAGELTEKDRQVGASAMSLRSVAAAVCVIVFSSLLTEAVAQTTDCQGVSADSVGVGIEQANASDAAWDGRALGQTFVALDSELVAITIWRSASPLTANIDPMRLYVCGVDSLGFPDSRNILADGPTIICPCQSDTPTPVRFVLQHPLSVVPGRQYSFAIKDVSSDCFGIFSARIDTLNDYANGTGFEFNSPVGCVGLGFPTFELKGADLIFSAEFCLGAVAARRTTWGQVKAAYH